MSRPFKLTRFRELVELTRWPAPLSYDLTPKNRKQRRVSDKLLRRAQAKRSRE